MVSIKTRDAAESNAGRQGDMARHKLIVLFLFGPLKTLIVCCQKNKHPRSSALSN